MYAHSRKTRATMTIALIAAALAIFSTGFAQPANAETLSKRNVAGLDKATSDEIKTKAIATGVCDDHGGLYTVKRVGVKSTDYFAVCSDASMFRLTIKRLVD